MSRNIHRPPRGANLAGIIALGRLADQSGSSAVEVAERITHHQGLQVAPVKLKPIALI
jgi:hypothetical protein